MKNLFFICTQLLFFSHPGISALCFDIPVFDVAYKFYVNDLLVSANGKVGTGLGLQLVRDLVDKSGGDLQIRSTLDKGSIFTFTIPIPNKQPKS